MEFTGCGIQRIPTNVSGNFIEIELYYSKGGLNVFTYMQEQRGYYVSVRPITVERNFVSFVVFSGKKMLVHQCGRKSPKAEREAVHNANECRDLIERLVREIARKNNLEVEV